MPVGLVIVSHSRDVAVGTAELAGQMAPSVAIRPAGGMDDGAVGTSFELIAAALDEADAGDGAVVLYDLGSALLTAETAVEFLEPDRQGRVQACAARRRDAGAVRLVVARLVDEPDTELAADLFQRTRHVEGVLTALQLAGAGNQRQWGCVGKGDATGRNKGVGRCHVIPRR